MKHEATQTEQEKPKREVPRVVVVNPQLHALLKQKAKAEGRIMQAMVEEALWPLVRPAALQLEAEGLQ